MSVALVRDIAASHRGQRGALLPILHAVQEALGCVPPEAIPVDAFSLIRWRRKLMGSLIGGIAETQEMLDFCAEKGITADIEKINIDYINTAYERLLKSDVKYRFVIDMESLKKS